jgi:hypothetical protein
MAAHAGAPVAAAHGRLAPSGRRRRVRRTALLCAAIAAAFYFGFIAMMLVRAAR